MKNRLFRIASSFTAVFFVILSLAAFSGPAAAAVTENDYGNPQFIEDFFVQEEIILKFKPNVPQSVTEKIYSKHKITKLQTNSRGIVKAKVPKGKSVEEMVTIISRNPNVEYAQPNYICYAVYSPNDPYYRYQWNLNNGTGGINAEDAWDLTDGSGAVVAILDTGIAYENYGIYSQAGDLAQTSFIPGYDFINNDAHANDDNAHGTHVAGTIAQSTNNRIGIAGVAYGATLMPVKVLGADGRGTSYNVADGIYYATDHGANIINMSLAWSVYQSSSGTWVASEPGVVVRNAIEYAYNHGVTLVAAAGNNGASVVAYPAAYDQCIAVGATTSAESLASFTNRGSALDLTAPGQSILQQTFNPNTRIVSDFGYWYFSGTSMASPHVAGVAALLFSLGVTEPAEIKQVLYETAEDHSTAGWDNQYGWGIVDAYAAVSSVGDSTNEVPVAANDSYTTNEDNVLHVAAPGVLTNDSDADGDLITAVMVNSPSNGTLSLNDDGSFEYMPDTDFNGSDSFTYKANDGKVNSDYATVSITVNPINDSPVAVNDTYSTTENTPLHVAAPGVLTNDSDVDDSPITASTVSSPSHGSLTLDADGSFEYTPDDNFIGSDSFTYIATDGTDSNIATVTIAIETVNHPPAALDQSVSTLEDTSTNITLEATDTDGDLLTYSYSNPSHGALSGTAPNLIYTPGTEFNGVDSFTFTANDGKTNSNPASISIRITSVNDPPVAAGDIYTTYEDTPLNITTPGVLGNDSDVDGNTLTAVIVSNPSYGTLTLNADGSFTYTPGNDFYGSDSFIYKANDGEADSNTASVTITVTPATTQTMRVENISFTTRSRTSRGTSFYRITATVLICDSSSVPLPEATVYGSWSGGYTGDVSGTTRGEGEVVFNTRWISGKTTLTFTVNNVTRSGWTYDPTQTESGCSITLD